MDGLGPFIAGKFRIILEGLVKEGHRHNVIESICRL
jgi:hypothetical protein